MQETLDQADGTEKPEIHLASGPVRVDEFLSVRQAAKLMGVSVRSVYASIETGRLLGIRIGASVAVHAETLHNYHRPVVGRPRTRTPVWRVPVAINLQYLTTITVRVREGEGAKLEQRLAEFRVSKKHMLPGTVARYIARNESDPNDVQIVLVWRKLAMPPAEEREAAIAALCADLADILDWQTASFFESQVLMNA